MGRKRQRKSRKRTRKARPAGLHAGRRVVWKSPKYRYAKLAKLVAVNVQEGRAILLLQNGKTANVPVSQLSIPRGR